MIKPLNTRDCRILTICILLVFLFGCGTASVPEFSTSVGVQKLSLPAKQYVDSELKRAFGTPTELVACVDLPVDYGSFSAQINPAGVDARFKAAVKSESGLARIEDLSRFANYSFTSSASSKFSHGTASYDSDFNYLTVDDPSKVVGIQSITLIGTALQNGRDLYHRHCVHCHGVAGDGQGPTAPYLTPRPRDYRKGIFKFTSTGTGVKAARDDIYRTVKLGIPGTYMPSFMLLPDHEVKALVEYVRWLSMRGEFEGVLVALLEGDFSADAVKGQSRDEVRNAFDKFLIENRESLELASLQDIAGSWVQADLDESVIKPKAQRTPSTDQSVLVGRKLFMDPKKGNCFSCHGETGRGDGPSTESRNEVPGRPGEKQLGLADIWGSSIKPRNLRQGIFRGGRRPVDIYRRIHSGIKGTPMQAFGTTLNDDEIWSLVNYVLSIPYESKPQLTH